MVGLSGCGERAEQRGERNQGAETFHGILI